MENRLLVEEELCPNCCRDLAYYDSQIKKWVCNCGFLASDLLEEELLPRCWLKLSYRVGCCGCGNEYANLDEEGYCSMCSDPYF